MIIFAAIELTSIAVMAWAYLTAEDDPDELRSAQIIAFQKRGFEASRRRTATQR
jgi:hypothetical protein